MTTDHAFFWFSLFQAKGIGPKSMATVQRALKLGSLEASIESLEELASKRRDSAITNIVKKVLANSEDETWRQYESLRAARVSVVHPGHPDYPASRLEGADQFGVSPVLFCKGNVQLLATPCVAIVGSRDVSEEGAKAARRIAADLALAGYNVVSGYARGVDMEAHRGALESGGTTTMVLSYGILEFRPKRFMRSIRFEESCLAVSQWPPQEPWRARNAMARNKLVCALSLAVVVVEAKSARDTGGKVSGSYDAAQAARKMGRPLFVVSPDCLPVCPSGNIDLIRSGGISLDPEDAANTIAPRLNGSKDGLNSAARSAGEATQGCLFDPSTENS